MKPLDYAMVFMELRDAIKDELPEGPAQRMVICTGLLLLQSLLVDVQRIADANEEQAKQLKRIADKWTTWRAS